MDIPGGPLNRDCKGTVQATVAGPKHLENVFSNMFAATEIEFYDKIANQMGIT